MWQRIQTLYLFISTVLVALLFFCNKAEGVSFTEYFPYLVFIIVITLLNIIALTTYKFRVLQMRTAVLSAIVTIAFQVWLAVDFFTFGKMENFHLTAVFPIAAVILDFLAARSIFADELMVRSASRLRSAKRRGGSGRNNTKTDKK
ncbi:MAG TPA: DUF4293 domain-containing protein [Candidatus Cryptobacteroides merdipullorum]|uniref:DUF4293 domain-containing protein n=1 Tax=Candidatus Cryptobacteroides merdipullorum TaxID=2840771 RepID=A0A9D1GPJ5_9BACT|nr:DUF4293 domain-containing protein [Candidatus Cryptobacteroides merdipullorum]